MLHTKHCQWPGPSEGLRELYGKKRCLCRKGGGRMRQEKETVLNPCVGFRHMRKFWKPLGCSVLMVTIL